MDDITREELGAKFVSAGSMLNPRISGSVNEMSRFNEDAREKADFQGLVPYYESLMRDPRSALGNLSRYRPRSVKGAEAQYRMLENAMTNARQAEADTLVRRKNEAQQAAANPELYRAKPVMEDFVEYNEPEAKVSEVLMPRGPAEVDFPSAPVAGPVRVGMDLEEGAFSPTVAEDPGVGPVELPQEPERVTVETYPDLHERRAGTRPTGRFKNPALADILEQLPEELRGEAMPYAMQALGVLRQDESSQRAQAAKQFAESTAAAEAQHGKAFWGTREGHQMRLQLYAEAFPWSELAQKVYAGVDAGEVPEYVTKMAEEAKARMSGFLEGLSPEEREWVEDMYWGQVGVVDVATFDPKARAAAFTKPVAELAREVQKFKMFNTRQGFKSEQFKTMMEYRNRTEARRNEMKSLTERIAQARVEGERQRLRNAQADLELKLRADARASFNAARAYLRDYIFMGGPTNPAITAMREEAARRANAVIGEAQDIFAGEQVTPPDTQLPSLGRPAVPPPAGASTPGTPVPAPGQALPPGQTPAPPGPAPAGMLKRWNGRFFILAPDPNAQPVEAATE